ncbi:MAG: carboxylating nicotinate-nucleotide diphosphorylase [Pseudobdellovibrionaceae bacterium]
MLEIKNLIDLALAEDMPGRKDITSDVLAQSLQKKQKFGIAKLKAKQNLTLSASVLFEETMKTEDPSIQIMWQFKDSQKISSGQNVCSLEGNLISILRAERVALNFLGRFSGIATMTQKFSDAIQGTKTRILDTRKTMPLYRDWEKKAVRDGGALNHRRDLSDRVMIKDNHIAMMGSIENAVIQMRKDSTRPLIVEASNLDQVIQCVSLKVDRILLDNMTNDQIKTCLNIIPADIEVEVSGNMSLDRVLSVAELGVDFISVGAMTHSAPVADFSLLIEWAD